MLVPNQYFDIKIIKTNIEHYTKLGYDVRLKDVIKVPAEHLTKGSHQLVDVECDICKKIIHREYRRYLINHTYGYNTCSNCSNEKTKKTVFERYGVYSITDSPIFKEKVKQTCLKKYGCEHYSQTDDFKQKFKNSCLERYGVESPAQSDIVKKKIASTNIEKYGHICPLNNDNIREKSKATILEHYGVDSVSQAEEIKEKKRLKSIEKYGVGNISQSEEIKEKKKQTMLNHYGYEYVLQVPEFKEKMFKTMSTNNSVPTSKQQMSLYKMLLKKYNDVEMNYPFSKCCLDIFISIDDIKIDVEYDGWYWHQDEQKDIKRDKFLQQNGFKVLRIRSGHKLPTEEQLFEAINKLIETDRKFTEIILDDWKTTNKGGEESA